MKRTTIIKSNLRIVDLILEENNHLDCFQIAHCFEFGLDLSPRMKKIKKLNAEDGILHSVLKYVIDTNDISILSKNIQRLFKHLAISYEELENANYHCLNVLVGQYAKHFRIFELRNDYWNYDYECSCALQCYHETPLFTRFKSSS